MCFRFAPETLLRVATVVKQIVTAVNTAASEKEIVTPVTRVVMTVMNLNGH
jgi:hypothetical protein